MAWSTSIPIDHTKVFDIPAAIRAARKDVADESFTLTGKTLAAPIVDNVKLAKTSVVATAATGAFQVFCTSIGATSAISVLSPNNVTIPIIKDDALYAHTGLTVVRTASMNSNIVFRNGVSTAIGQIVVANTQSDAIMYALLNSEDGSDKGSIQIAAAAATDSGRAGAILVYGVEHGTYPGQIRLRKGSADTGFISACTSVISNLVNPVDAQDAATKKYIDDNFGYDTQAFRYVEVDDGSPAKTKVYTKYLKGSTAGAATTTIAHGCGGIDNILSVTCMIKGASDSLWKTANFAYAVASNYFLTIGEDNILITHAAEYQGQAYVIRIDYLA